MKLVLDANISWKLCEQLKEYFEVIHVDHCQLSMPAKDLEIWNFAKKNNYVIVTKDDDFVNFSNLYGFPPKVIILKTGNQKTNIILQIFVSNLENIQSFSNDLEVGILEIFKRN